MIDDSDLTQSTETTRLSRRQLCGGGARRGVDTLRVDVRFFPTEVSPLPLPVGSVKWCVCSGWLLSFRGRRPIRPGRRCQAMWHRRLRITNYSPPNWVTASDVVCPKQRIASTCGRNLIFFGLTSARPLSSSPRPKNDVSSDLAAIRPIAPKAVPNLPAASVNVPKEEAPS